MGTMAGLVVRRSPYQTCGLCRYDGDPLTDTILTTTEPTTGNDPHLKQAKTSRFQW